MNVVTRTYQSVSEYLKTDLEGAYEFTEVVDVGVDATHHDWRFYFSENSYLKLVNYEGQAGVLTAHIGANAEIVIGNSSYVSGVADWRIYSSENGLGVAFGKYDVDNQVQVFVGKTTKPDGSEGICAVKDNMLSGYEVYSEDHNAGFMLYRTTAVDASYYTALAKIISPYTGEVFKSVYTAQFASVSQTLMTLNGVTYYMGHGIALKDD